MLIGSAFSSCSLTFESDQLILHREKFKNKALICASDR